MSILRIRDAQGNVQEILAIRGEKGDSYKLTEQDKQEIAGMVPSGGCGDELLNYYNKDEVDEKIYFLDDRVAANAARASVLDNEIKNGLNIANQHIQDLEQQIPGIDAKTVDKIKVIDTFGTFGGTTYDSDGITWGEEFHFLDKNEDAFNFGTMIKRIPLMQGDNVTLAVEDGFVKINAIGNITDGDLQNLDKRLTEQINALASRPHFTEEQIQAMIDEKFDSITVYAGEYEDM